MSSIKRRKKGYLFNRKRYWYHVSTTLTKKKEKLIPWGTDKGFNRGGDEPEGKRICVAPSIEQCITAVPYALSTEFTIYRTKDKVKAKQAENIFDIYVTNEGWIQVPTEFVKIGILDFETVEQKMNVENVIPEAASRGHAHYSGKVLRWWERARINRFIKST